MQMTVGSLSVHVQWFSHQNDGADYHDIITYTLGSFTKPQTLYFGCLSASCVGSITQMYSVTCFINK